MSRTVVFLQSAADDLHEIRHYVRKHFSHAVWLDSYAKIKTAILNLEQFPQAGHPLPELPATHFLQIIAVKNRVIYEVVGDKVYVHLICDSRQDFKIKLARRPLRTLRP
ncbi:type II toxin-antitoxin system RelE/ParE family toxin [Achromobacter sp. MFA1 R4]|uniref:type II toxin-antitoxin system RelE/ParE family toxin n=1 Tax=Achromobacter sp. MFA1 R4 TaxID=1881016 RepID=UPI0009539967|nr:type II toxin-antitoxin system RelE/ParE family toxin [Achromobacter sp. MFA1 R4]SIT28756.1 Plasmid stabilization system protein ParE [Achromobacter sp. MFA1 R4]